MDEINHLRNPFKYKDQSGETKDIDTKYQNRTKIAATVGGIFTLGLAAAPIVYGMSAYYRSKCRQNPETPTVERMEDLRAKALPGSEFALLKALKKRAPDDISQSLENFFKTDAQLNPEEWAKILPHVQEHLISHPENQAFWENRLKQKFDPSTDPVVVLNESLPKSLLTSQSEVMKTMFADSSSGVTEIEFPAGVSDLAKERFLSALKEGLKGKHQEYPSDEKTALELYNLANYFDVKWMQTELQHHLILNVDPFAIYKAIDFSDISSANLNQLEKSPHKRLYLACAEKMVSESLSNNDKLENLVNLINKTNDTHLLRKLCEKSDTMQEGSLDKLIENLTPSKIYEVMHFATGFVKPNYDGLHFACVVAMAKECISDNGKFQEIVKLIKTSNDQRLKAQVYEKITSSPLPEDPNELIDRLEQLHTLLELKYSLNATIKINDGIKKGYEKLGNSIKPDNIMNILESAIRHNQNLIYNKVLAHAALYAKSQSIDERQAFESLQEYGKKNQLLDFELIAIPELEYNGSMKYESSKVEILHNAIANNPQSKMLARGALEIAPQSEPSLPQKSKEDISSLLQSGIFGSVTMAGSDEDAKGIADALEKGLQLEVLAITGSKDLTNEGLKAITDGLKNSQVFYFLITQENFTINEETAASLAEGIKTNEHLEYFDLECNYQSKKAWDLISNAALAATADGKIKYYSMGGHRYPGGRGYRAT